MDASQAVFKTRNEKAISLINEWLADESGYDVDVWPKLRKNIESNRLSERKRFDDYTCDAGHGATRENNTPS